MVYKLDFIYKIYCGTHVTDGVTVNIVVRGYHGSIPGGVLKKEKKSIHLLYVLYILSVIYIVYILYAYYTSYILPINVESKVSGI